MMFNKFCSSRPDLVVVSIGIYNEKINICEQKLLLGFFYLLCYGNADEWNLMVLNKCFFKWTTFNCAINYHIQENK